MTARSRGSTTNCWLGFKTMCVLVADKRRSAAVILSALSCYATLAAGAGPKAADQVALADETFLLAGNTLVSQDQGIRINIDNEWLVRESEYPGDYVPFADFDSQALTFSVAPGVLGVHLSSYGIQDEGSAGSAWGRDVFLAIDVQSAEVIGRLPDLGISKSRVKTMGCMNASNDLFLLGDIDEDGAADIAVLGEEVSCEDVYDQTEGSRKILERHRWGVLKWYVFDGSGWRYNSDLDGQCTPQILSDLPWPGLARGPVDFALATSRRNTERQPLPPQVAACVAN